MTITHTTETGNALRVYAHPRRESFNAHLLQAGTEALAARYRVQTSELYAGSQRPRPR